TSRRSRASFTAALTFATSQSAGATGDTAASAALQQEEDVAVTYTPLDLTLQRYAIGRGIVFYADKWDGTTPLALTNLGVTEGEITVELNEEYSTLTFMDQSGPAQHMAYVSGEFSVVTLPLFY